MRMKKIAAIVAGLSLCAGFANAGVISGWDMTNVTVTPEPYTEYVTYPSILYTDATKTDYHGVIT